MFFVDSPDYVTNFSFLRETDILPFGKTLSWPFVEQQRVEYPSSRHLDIAQARKRVSVTGWWRTANLSVREHWI